MRDFRRASKRRLGWIKTRPIGNALAERSGYLHIAPNVGIAYPFSVGTDTLRP